MDKYVPHAPSLGKYLAKVDRVMTEVDRITEDIAHMPVAAFIFRDKESDEVHYSSEIRYTLLKGQDRQIQLRILGTKCLLLWCLFL